MLSVLLGWFWPLRLQTVLTIVTMAVGSFALAVTVFVGDGALSSLWKDLDQLMGNRLDIYSDVGPNESIYKKRPFFEFTETDIQELHRKLPWVKFVEPMFNGRMKIFGNYNYQVLQIDGLSKGIQREPMYLPLKGRGFSKVGISGFVMECMLTETAARLLKVDLALNNRVSTERDELTVVGIVKDPPETDLRFSARMILPYYTARSLWGELDKISTIVLCWGSPEDSQRTVEAVQEILSETRGPGTYFLSSSMFRVNKGRSIIDKFMIFGTFQSLFSILIASIGVINVMLTNIVRRGQEFAIRISFGASLKELSVLVLIESLLLGLAGALIGILIAVILTPQLAMLISSNIREIEGLKYAYSMRGFFLPLAVCGFSSIFAGISPAIRVAKLDILTSLRNS
jgi:ABC-type antimicrobial peptide transport system permease subunit